MALQTDREIAYEQNVTGLEKAWETQIASFAAQAVRKVWDNGDYEFGTDELQLEASHLVAARLLDSLKWENVKATDISDIAYEACGVVIDSNVYLD